MAHHGEDCEAALAAMAAADPDLDPVWGLLVDAADAGLPTPSPRSARTPSPRSARVDGPSVAGVAGPERTTSPDESTRASSNAGASEVKRKPISAVVDKAEMPQSSFRLPSVPHGGVKRWDVRGCDAFVLDGVLSPEECAALLEQSRGLWSFWDDSEEPRVAFRNAHTIEVMHDAIADVIWSRISHLLVPSLTFDSDDDPRFEVDIEGTWIPYAVNPRLLFSMYNNGGHFSPHTDGTTVVDFNRRTFYSCVLFLNESPWGGHTRLYADEQMRKELVPDKDGRLTGDSSLILDEVPPKAGRMLVFYHRLMHEGVPAAEKYIIRTDILYRRSPEICTAPEDVEAFGMYQDAQLRAERGECDAAADLFRRAFKRSPALREVYKM